MKKWYMYRINTDWVEKEITNSYLKDCLISTYIIIMYRYVLHNYINLLPRRYHKHSLITTNSSLYFN